jgi:hypothetical protein
MALLLLGLFTWGGIYVGSVAWRVLRNVNTQPFPTVAYAYTHFRPLGWYLSRRDAGLTKHVRTIVSIMMLDGLHVRTPRIRRLHHSIDPGDTKGVCWAQKNLILIDYKIAIGEVALCFYIVGHEMGHYIDACTGRQGHRLFDLIRDKDSEGFANAFMWYCMEYARYFSENRPFDWEEFTRELPKLMELTANHSDIASGAA